MNYVTSYQETGETPSKASAREPIIIRKLTEGQGARSPLYEVREATGKLLRWQRVESASRVSRGTAKLAKREVAEREHMGRLHRECQIKAKLLLESQDPVESALIGASLLNILQDLWLLREGREDDWTEILNLLQITLTHQEFEILSLNQRIALDRIFHECLLVRNVGRSDVERTLQVLSDSGFDVWRGIAERLSEPPPTKRLVDLRALIQDAAETMREQLRQRQLTLNVEVSPELPSVECSPSELLKVLLNLLENATEASPQGGMITVHVSGQKAELRISVTDGGAGIHPDVLPHIFEPFFSTKTTDLSSSRRLRLLMSHSLVEAMGGHIEVGTTVGKGSTFRVILPFAH